MRAAVEAMMRDVMALHYGVLLYAKRPASSSDVPVAIKLAQALIGVAGVFLVAAIARRVAGDRAALPRVAHPGCRSDVAHRVSHR